MSVSPAGAAAPDAKESTKPEPRPIRSIRGLVEALTAHDAATRVSALRAIQTQPQAALAFGLHNGQDIIDILLTLATGSKKTVEWANWVGTLGIFRDARVTDFFLHVLETSRAPAMIFSATRYLAECDLAGLGERLSSLLLDNEGPVRARAVTRLLEKLSGLGEAAQLRVALLSESGDARTPQLDVQNVKLWLAELDGPFWREAQLHLRCQGEGAWIIMAREWQRLGEQSRIWLLQWGSEEVPQMTTSLLLNALSSGIKDVRIEGLKVLATLRDSSVPEAIESIAAKMLEDPDAEVREWAVRAAPASQDWRAFLEREQVAFVRRACIPQLARSEGEKAKSDLIEFLHSEDWQIRAQAAAALARMERDAKT